MEKSDIIEVFLCFHKYTLYMHKQHCNVNLKYYTPSNRNSYEQF